MILTLQTTTFSENGGIPRYNRMVCRALNEVAESAIGSETRVMIGMDQRQDVPSGPHLLPKLSLEAFGGNRLAFIRRAIRITLGERIDLLLVGHINYAPLGILLKCLRPGLRYGVMVHGIEVWSKVPLMKRWALQHADFVTSVSEYTKARMVAVNGVRPERVRILPDTIDWKGERQQAEDNGLRADGLRLLSVCRLEAREKYKGVDTVIEALPSVIDHVPDVGYVVIGSGSDLERHRALARERGVGDRVHFLGSVDDATLREAYNACDIFVLPSAGEGFGIVYLEAMNYSKPVIAANSGAAPEVVKDGETGILVEYGNRDQLADAIIKLCLDRDLRKTMGAAGYERLQQNFTFDHFKTRLRELILPQLTGECSIPQDTKADAGLAA